MKLALAAIFFGIAAVYASVGFGGGSSYTAVLAITGASYLVIPIVSLICNICVVTGSSLRYARADLIDWSSTWPFFVLSIPLAWAGGRLQVSETMFIGLLSGALLAASGRLLISRPETSTPQALTPSPPPFASSLIGGAIGFYSGIVGIGGGIILAPILYRLKWAGPKQIAALCSVFILVNSVFGLAGHVSKIGSDVAVSDIISHWPLVTAVILGGALGNGLGMKLFPEAALRRITGVLILVVAIRLGVKWMGLMGYL